jgi:hypothetical protein
MNSKAKCWNGQLDPLISGEVGVVPSDGKKTNINDPQCVVTEPKKQDQEPPKLQLQRNGEMIFWKTEQKIPYTPFDKKTFFLSKLDTDRCVRCGNPNLPKIQKNQKNNKASLCTACYVNIDNASKEKIEFEGKILRMVNVSCVYCYKFYLLKLPKISIHTWRDFYNFFKTVEPLKLQFCAPTSTIANVPEILKIPIDYKFGMCKKCAKESLCAYLIKLSKEDAIRSTTDDLPVSSQIPYEMLQVFLFLDYYTKQVDLKVWYISASIWENQLLPRVEVRKEEAPKPIQPTIYEWEFYKYNLMRMMHSYYNMN